MARTIGIFSGKGGVGKTTLSSNLAYALTEIGKDVIVVDANLTTPHLGLHFGMHLAPKNLHDVLRGNTKLNNAIYSHPYGFKFIPGSMSVNDLSGVDVGKLPSVISNLSDKTDFIIVDPSPGLGREAISAMQTVDDVLVITNPDLPSVADALKTVRVAEKLDKKVLGVVVNRVKGIKHELTSGEIEEMLAKPVISEIPEDTNIPKSIAVKWSVVDYASDSPASIEIKRLANRLVGNEYMFKKTGQTFLERLVSWFTG